MNNKICIRIFFLTSILSFFFFYQICNKVVFFKMLPFLQLETHLHNGYSLACKLVLLYILLNVEEILPSGESSKIINLNFRQWERNDYSSLCNYCDKRIHLKTRLYYYQQPNSRSKYLPVIIDLFFFLCGKYRVP